MNCLLRRALSLCLTVVLLISFSSCKRHRNPSYFSGMSPTSVKTTAQVTLKKPADEGELEKRVKAELTRRYDRQYAGSVYLGSTAQPVGQPTGISTATGMLTAAGNNTATDSRAGTEAPVYSDTNVQEKGVDEGDLVKTDGKYIYLARGTRFFILAANPVEDSAIVSDTDVMEQISEMYLSGSKILLITSPITVYPAGGVTLSSATVIPYRPVTHVYVYDVSTPEVPILTASFDLPGSVKGSRRITNRLYLITNTTIDLPAAAKPADYLSTGTSASRQDFLNACEQARQENLRRIEKASLDELLPNYTTTLYTGGTHSSTTSPAAVPGTTYIADPGNGSELSLVVSMDLSANPPTVSTSSILTAATQIYMSTSSLYLASANSWLWIEPLAGADTPAGNPDPGTSVHKFCLDGSGKPVYKGSGAVEGWINDRFSMGDHEGYLRVGTTRGGWWGEAVSNQLAVLAEDGEDPGGLKVVGTIAGLAPGERIYSMRFDRERGYMVTFKQTDPLFTFDLKDPRNPRVAGEVKVNGFATYIHLLGTEGGQRLLTIGRSADSAGRVTGNKLQLFDVADLASPKATGEYELGPGWSTALYDPHAFLYYEPLGLLAIPYYAYGTGTYSYSSGLSVFTIGSSSISLKGEIPAAGLTAGYGSYPDTVDRSVIIGNAVFAIAHRSVTAATAGQLNVLKTIQLPESYAFPGGAGVSGQPTVVSPSGILPQTGVDATVGR